MSTVAIFDTTVALKRRIEAAIDGKVVVGPPTRTGTSGFSASLFLYQVEPNRDLRNEEVFTAGGSGPFAEPAAPTRAIPLDLRFLVSVFRTTGSGDQADPNELARLGEIIAALEDQPFLADPLVPGQTVRVTLEPASMEDFNRIWGLFPGDSYQTSIIYLATPVYVLAGTSRRGPPVQTHERRSGLSTEVQRPMVEAVP